jgi:hypothetical protein
VIEEPIVSLAFLMVAPGLGDYYEVSQSVPVSLNGKPSASAVNGRATSPQSWMAAIGDFQEIRLTSLLFRTTRWWAR